MMHGTTNIKYGDRGFSEYLVLPSLCHSVMLHTHIRLGRSLGSFQKAMLSRKSGDMGQKNTVSFGVLRGLNCPYISELLYQTD